MANQSTALDLHAADEVFAEDFADLLTLKVNRLARWLPADSQARAVAPWSNLVDDFMLQAKALLRLQYTGSGSPAGSVAAPVGAVYLNSEASPTGSRMWIKATGSGTSGWEQVGGELEPGDVTLDLLEDAPGLSLLGRDATGTGVRADIVSGGARRFMASDSGNTAIAFRALESADLPTHATSHRPGSSDGLDVATPVPIGSSLAEGSANSFARSDHVHTVSIEVVSRVLYEVSYASLADNAFSDGTEVLDGLSYTSVNTALLGTAGNANGGGIDLRAGNSLGTGSTFNSTTRNAYHLYIPLSSIPNWDGRYDCLIEIYASLHTLEQNGDSFFCGLWGVSGSPSASAVERVRVARISNQGGTQQLGSTNQATSTNGSNRGSENVIGTKLQSKGEGSAMFGVWSTTWPSSLSADTCFTSESGVLSPFDAGAVRLVMGLGTVNDASATTRVLIERLRVSR